MMETDDKRSPPLDCPQGASNCPIYSEIERLNDEVKKLRAEASTDSLTGLYNKRYFYNALLTEMDRTQRTGQPTTLVLVDLDHFKQINDRYGHVVGDKVLAHIAEILHNSLRKLDIPCRYGGEEFAVLLPSTPLLVAVQVTERLRQQISQREFASEGDRLAITASFGVDTFLAKSQETAEDFVARVDKQLYQAKHNGRNCVQHGVIKRRADHTINRSEKNLLGGTQDSE